jgi:VWFA-related protein
MVKDRITSRWVAAAGVPLLVLLCTMAAGSSLAQRGEDRPLRPSGRILPERAEVNLVLIDVLVTGRGGEPSRGLKQEDFDLLIDRLPAPISSFESYCPAEVDAPGEGPSDEPQEAEPTGAEPRHVVLFFDVNHLTKSGKARSIDAALQYVRNDMEDHHSVMILAMKGQPILIEPFTSDRERLSARLEEMRADDDMLDLSYLDESLNVLDIMSRECTGQEPSTGPISRCNRRLTVALPYAVAEEMKARRSLEALRSLMPALAAIRGRKTVVHFSESLRDEPGLQYLILAGATPGGEGIDMKQVIQDLHREANTAGVALYMVWAAGLGEGSGTGLTDASARLSADDTLLVQKSHLAGEDAAIALGATLALETGGTAQKRSNDLGKVFRSVSSDVSCYYVLGYVNPGPGEGTRHSIIVKAKEKKLRVRHRPYFMDWSEDERLERRFRSALMAPAFFRDFTITAEAYALAPRKKKTPFLFKVEFPLEEVTLVRQADGTLYGEAEVRGTVWSEAEETCKFSRRIPVTVGPGEKIGDRKVIYEAGCDLPPGRHEFSVGVLDSGTWSLGAADVSVPVSRREPGILGDVVLWTSSGGDILEATDAASVGIHAEGSGHGFVPRSERRFGQREAGVLYVIVCPPESGVAEGKGDIEVRRTLFAGETEVAAFAPVKLSRQIVPPDRGEAGESRPLEKGACEGLFAPIPPGQLGPGGYIFEVQVDGISAQPVIHRAGFALRENVRNTPGS